MKLAISNTSDRPTHRKQQKLELWI